MTAVPAEVRAPKTKTPSWRRFVPGTREWRRETRRVMFRRAAFHRLMHSRFASEDRKSVRMPLRHHANNLAVLDVGEEQVTTFAGWSFLLLAAVAMGATFSLFARRGPAHSLLFQTAALLVAFVLLFPAASIMFAPAGAKKGALIFGPRRFFVFLSALIGTAYAMIAVRYLVKGHAMSHAEYVGGLAVGFAAILGAVIVISQGVQVMIGRYFTWRRLASFPESVAIDGLLFANLWSTEPTSVARANVPLLLDYLEKASVAVTHIPLTLPLADAATEAWTKRQFAGIAAAIRELERYAILPQPDSETRIASASREIALALIQRNWAAISRAEPAKVVRKTIVTRAMQAVRTIVIAVAPITGLTLLKSRLATTVDPDLLKGLMTAAYVWAAVGVMMVIDPDFTAKLGGTNLSSLLSGGKGGEHKG